MAENQCEGCTALGCAQRKPNVCVYSCPDRTTSTYQVHGQDEERARLMDDVEHLRGCNRAVADERDRFREENERLRAEANQLMNESVSERCRRTHWQCCHQCEDIECCDNQSKTKAERDQLRAEVYSERSKFVAAGVREHALRAEVERLKNSPVTRCFASEADESKGEMSHRGSCGRAEGKDLCRWVDGSYCVWQWPHHMREERKELVTVRAEVERLKADYQEACSLVAKMHGETSGKWGDGPRKGVVEDVTELRLERDRLKLQSQTTEEQLEHAEESAESLRIAVHQAEKRARVAEEKLNKAREALR